MALLLLLQQHAAPTPSLLEVPMDAADSRQQRRSIAHALLMGDYDQLPRIAPMMTSVAAQLVHANNEVMLKDEEEEARRRSSDAPSEK